MSANNNVAPDHVFLVMGLEDKAVMFAVVVAGSAERASQLFQEKHPTFEVMSASSLAEMNDAVTLLSYVQQGRDVNDAAFPMPVYRDPNGVVDAGAFGL